MDNRHWFNAAFNVCTLFALKASWVILGGGIVGGICRDCKAGVTVIGSAVTLFLVVVGTMWLLYAIGGVFN